MPLSPTLAMAAEHAGRLAATDAAAFLEFLDLLHAGLGDSAGPFDGDAREIARHVERTLREWRRLTEPEPCSPFGEMEAA